MKNGFIEDLKMSLLNFNFVIIYINIYMKKKTQLKI